ncbi:hypothetical protein I3842_01G122700 [Carya illinoinensis]|uniref:Chromosome transmission fidelity protein 18 homolog n=1 Tax=Carya illinoinensis TaxID=32201 RepID=A0A922G4T6_CARIL|nr:hypothetical protein I3842_01G122700 [Carya illinoinensis]
MDMDMDIPLPEELELLESNSQFYDDYLDLEPPEPYPEEDEHQPQPQLSLPTLSLDPPLLFEIHSNGQKRPRSDGADASTAENVGLSDEKRSRVDDVGSDSDEEWLRYSPPHRETNPDAEEQGRVTEEKIVSRYASHIDGDCIPVTSPSGDRVYAKICRVVGEERSKKLDMKEQSGGLILEPVNILLQRVEQEAFTKALQASSEGQTDITLPERPVVHEQLWVDKYAPSSFPELLSDEQTNREVLLWLKQWDSYVFGSEIRSTSDEVLSALRRHSSIAQHQKHLNSNFLRKNRGPKWHNERFRNSNHLENESSNLQGLQDSWNKKSRLTGLPEQKILLLCGPPGLGKTTLAHIAAKHCGYHAVEVNASDDRSSSTMEAKILDVVQMNSVMADSRPKCLVIDEIDGALSDGKGAVEVLLKMVSAEKKSDMGKENVAKEEQSGKKSSKKGHKTASLSRPVICICNDLYAPALRTLRQVAKVHVFVCPTASRVVSRLKYICNKEGMKTSSIALTALAEYTECDIRSCLNTLQFLNKKNETLSVLEIGSQVVGQKDMSRSAFDIWKEVFQRRQMKREIKSNNSSSRKCNEFDLLHSLISNRGDYDLIFDGIHENVLHLHYHDPLMQKTVKCLNSLGVSDMMHQHILHTQHMALLVYLPPSVISVHHLVAQLQKPSIEWPKSYQRYRTMWLEKMETVRSWHYKIPPYISRHMSIKSFVEDLISPLLHILSPPTLRPVALQLLSEREKNDLAQLVSTMVSYAITYKNVKSDPLPIKPRHESALEASSLSFDPSIDDFVGFKDYNSGHCVLALAMKQVLLHEVEKQKILQVSIRRSMHTTDGCTKERLDFVNMETSRAPTTNTNDVPVNAEKNIGNEKIMLNIGLCNPSTSKISSNLASSENNSAGLKLKSHGDQKKPFRGSSSFFDRFKKLSSKGSQTTDMAVKKEVTLERDLRPLLFKFNEGFTNAVKRPVRIRDFLL